MPKCPACGFWKLNEFMNRKKCKRCGYVNKSDEEIEKEIEENKLKEKKE